MKKKLNKELLGMGKKGKILVKIYKVLRSNAAQLARLYGLAREYKKGKPSETCSLYPGKLLQ